MHGRDVVRSTLTTLAAAAAAVACANATSPADRGPDVVLAVSTAPDFAGTVTRAWFESGYGPGSGWYEQWDVWVAVAPSVLPNAGVVAGKNVPMFLRSGGHVTRATGGDIRAGDRVEVWRVPVFVGYGAVQGPPDSPTYEGRQIVIVR